MATCPACKGEFDASFCPRDGNRLIEERLLGDRYRLIRKVGEGAMGEVHEGLHVHLNRPVAVKLLQRKIASDPEASARLRREARSTTGLGHPNIVDTIDFGFAADGQAYLVMEWLDGENLDERMARGPIDVATALDITAQTAAGVAAAHDRGVVHRDLKPANLFLTRDHRGGMLVKVLDFGIAKLAFHETKLTATGVLIGTPNYMAPEQAEGMPTDVRTDVYAIGAILYEMLTGTVPFRGETPLSVLHQHTSRLPILPSARAPERGIPDAVDQIVMRCLAKRPEERFATMHELGAAIAAIAGVSAEPARRAPVATTRREISPDDDDDFEAAVAASARRSWVVPVAIGAVAVAGVAVAVIVLARGGGAPAVVHVDAPPVASARPDAPTAVIVQADAPLAPVAADAASVDVPSGLAYPLRGHHITGTLLVRPAIPVAGEPIELSIDLGTLDARFRDAAATGRLTSTVDVEYFKTDTSVAPPANVVVDGTGRFAVSFVIAHATKHHVHVDVLIDGKEVDHAKVDLWPDLH